MTSDGCAVECLSSAAGVGVRTPRRSCCKSNSTCTMDQRSALSKFHQLSSSLCSIKENIADSHKVENIGTIKLEPRFCFCSACGIPCLSCFSCRRSCCSCCIKGAAGSLLPS